MGIAPKVVLNCLHLPKLVYYDDCAETVKGMRIYQMSCFKMNSRFVNISAFYELNFNRVVKRKIFDSPLFIKIYLKSLKTLASF